jgi:hypothetical protein
VVALHHSGVPKRNEAKEVITTDGRVWEEWMGEQRIAWLANEGVRVSRLVRHIRSQPLAAAAEPLRQQLLEATPMPPVAGSISAAERLQPPAAETEPPPSPPLPLTTPPQPVVAQPAAALLATLTIPLQVSVSLGSPLLANAAPSPVTASGNGVIAGRRGGPGGSAVGQAAAAASCAGASTTGDRCRFPPVIAGEQRFFLADHTLPRPGERAGL